MAESLIYYDRVLLAPASEAAFGWVSSTPPPVDHQKVVAPAQPPFLELVDWFAKTGHYDDFIALLNDGSIAIYHYAFKTLPMLKDGVYSLWNAQDSEEAAGPTFERRILGDRRIASIVSRGRAREKLHRALRDKIVEVHSNDFSRAIENARLDFVSAAPATVAVQAVVDDVFDLMGLSSPPDVLATTTGSAEQTHISWNIDFGLISRALSPGLVFSVPTPLIGLAHSNRAIWSAAPE